MAQTLRNLSLILQLDTLFVCSVPQYLQEKIGVIKNQEEV